MSVYVLDQTVPIRALLPARAMGVISVAVTAFATIPPSSIVGAVLWAGYFGNLVVSHLNMI